VVVLVCGDLHAKAPLP